MTTVDLKVAIYIRRKKIMRNGKRVYGWQAGFSRGPTGGVTSVSRDEVIEHQRALAKRMGVTVFEVIEE